MASNYSVNVLSTGDYSITVNPSVKNINAITQPISIGVTSFSGVGPQGPPGQDGTVDPGQISVIMPSGTTSLQSAITLLANEFIQGSTAPSTVNVGNLWYDTSNARLKIYESGTWVPVTVTPDLSVADLDGGYF